MPPTPLLPESARGHWTRPLGYATRARQSYDIAGETFGEAVPALHQILEDHR
jgi:hypothetical protein